MAGSLFYGIAAVAAIFGWLRRGRRQKPPAPKPTPAKITWTEPKPRYVQPVMLTVAEAAEESGKSETTIYRWIKSGRLPSETKDDVMVVSRLNLRKATRDR